MSSEIKIQGDKLSVHFSEFTPAEYELFLLVKKLPEYTVIPHHDDLTYTITAPARFASLLGVSDTRTQDQDLPLLTALLDDQRAIVPTALEARRYAIWADCGLGKTLMGLEWARHVIHRTSGRVLCFTMKSIIPQWAEEAAKFYGEAFPVAVLETREEMREWCKGHGTQAHIQFAITNYEKMNHEDLNDQVVSELRLCAGVILDESSRLKTGAGTQKWALIKSCKGIEYKLSLTATPAPNDVMEFSSQASFLEKLRSENEIIWTYFTRDPVTNEWTVKAHARDAFYRFMASWSIYLRNPKRYGWRLSLPDVPEPDVFEHQIPTTSEQRQWIAENRVDETGNLTLINTGSSSAIDRVKLSEVAKGFVYQKGEAGKYDLIPSIKPGFVAELVKKELKSGHQALVWTSFNAESDIITRILQDMGMGNQLATFSGKTKEEERARQLEAFRVGRVPCLISKPSLLGYGLNFQHCTSMVFSGFNDSYEQFYQAWRRAVRFGQTKRVRIHVPFIPELEGESWDNLMKKKAQDESAVREMEEAYIKATTELRRIA